MKKIYEELFSGWTTKEAIYGWSLIALQIIFYMIYNKR